MPALTLALSISKYL